MVGFFIYPSLLPVPLQLALTEKLLHRDLSDPAHTTNLDLHYHLNKQAPSTSMFDCPAGTMLEPKDPAMHKPLTIQRALNKKLRWVTLGGQYDWTNKVYPDEVPPAFPHDIARLIQAILPDMEPQAAILNFYSPGDTLSVHRDVSEECNQPLISVSIGCDALFLLGAEDGSNTVTVRLHSGDAVVMSGQSRFAWHAVPKVIPGTCPPDLAAWPADPGHSRYESWRGWLGNKRLNLNVRQMRQAQRKSEQPR